MSGSKLPFLTLRHSLEFSLPNIRLLDKSNRISIHSAPMKLSSPTRLVRKLAVITLSFWLAGAGCLLGCEGMAAAAHPDHLKLTSGSNLSSTLIVEDEACASTEGHSCCKKKSRAARKPATAAPAAEVSQRAERDLTSTKLNESSTSGRKACPFAISRALSVAKLRDGQMSATDALSPVLPGQAARQQKLVLSAMSPLPNRGHTYLRCCSFLI